MLNAENGENDRSKAFHDYRDKLSDPRFFTPIKNQMQSATTNANAARTGGPIMIDKYMIPGELSEYKWLNDNISKVTGFYDAQRCIIAESEKRLFTGKKDKERRHRALILSQSGGRKTNTGKYTMIINNFNSNDRLDGV